MDNKCRIIFCGDVEGQFNSFFKRIDSLIAKSGPFDILFCVGNFFGPNNDQLDPYLLRDKVAPIGIYILGPTNPDYEKFYPKTSGEICENIHYLGKRGIFVCNGGLKVAYLSGLHGVNADSLAEYTKQDVVHLVDICTKGSANFQGVDLLLTSQWPTGVLNKTPDGSDKPTLTKNNTSDFPAWLSMKLKPRYHYAAYEGVYYQRPPFRYPQMGDDSTLNLATRFVGLCKIGGKGKWLSALNLVPLNDMKIGTLLEKTVDETECPYNFNVLQQKLFNMKRRQSASQYFFESTNEGDEEVEMKRQRTTAEPPANPTSKCWFCLSSHNFQKHLIMTIGVYTYIAVPKGGLTDEHFLICPIKHIQSSLNLPADIRAEIIKFKNIIQRFYDRKGQVPVIFERNYRTSHMQLQIIPVPKKLAKGLKQKFLAKAEDKKYLFHELVKEVPLEQVLKPYQPYFVVELPDGTILYTLITNGYFSLNFGREVLAGEDLLNLPGKVDWKDCVMSTEEEIKCVSALRKAFAPFENPNYTGTATTANITATTTTTTTTATPTTTTTTTTN